jgi:hypothetical protein
VFAKVFYNHLGFYGEDLKIAKLERFVDSRGKTDAFRAKFEEVNGAPWVEARASMPSLRTTSCPSCRAFSA